MTESSQQPYPNSNTPPPSNPSANPHPTATPVNPYAELEFQAPPATQALSAPAMASNIRNVTLLAILQIVLGAFEFAIGLLLIGVSFAVQFAAVAQSQSTKKLPPGAPDEALLEWMQVVYVIIGGIVIATALLRIIAGIACYHFRGRNFVIASMFIGLITSFTMYCAPFAIGICIFGTIVLLSPGAVRAFELRKEGLSREEVKRRLTS